MTVKETREKIDEKEGETVRKYFSAKELRVSEHRFSLTVEKQCLSEDMQKWYRSWCSMRDILIDLGNWKYDNPDLGLIRWGHYFGWVSKEERLELSTSTSKAK